MKNLLLCIFVCISAVTYGQLNDCSKFKEGTFKIVDAEVGNTIFERKGSKQIEYMEGSKAKAEFKVKWLNDCTYTLKLKKILENPDNMVFPKGMILTVEIIEVRENSYIQRTTSNLFDMVVTGEVIKIE